MSWGWSIRLALASLMIGLGLTIIGRSLWLAFVQGIALSALFLPLGVGIFMVAHGIGRWRMWIRMDRPKRTG